MASDLGETATSGAMPAANPARADGFRPGDQLGRYVIERVLGAGGMGLVYAAHDPDLDRRVAIKVLRGDASEESRARLLREARAMAKVSHPSVITVYEVGTAIGVDFVAMELLEGGSLADWLRAERRDPAEVLRRFRSAGAGLAAAHARGLVHRDFKPANVLLGRDGEVVVTDFGLARGFDSEALAATMPALPVNPPTAPRPVAATPVGLDDTMAAPPTPTPTTSRSQPVDLSSTLTRTGALLGTPAYMAPEQFASGNVGPAADQFAFAVALFEGLTGARPFRGATLDELRGAILSVTPDVGALPRAVRPVVARALAREPSARWPDMRAMLAALDRRLQRPLRLALAIFLAALLAAGVFIAVRSRGEPARSVAAPCVLTDGDVTAVWSPTTAAPLAQKFAGQPAWPQVASALDQFATTWQRERATTCAAPTAPSYHGRIACLAGLRDDLTAAVTLLGSGPSALLARAASTDMLPSPEVCRSGRRAAMPALPADPAIRRELSALMADGSQARMMASSGAAKEEARALVDAMLVRARKLAAAYPPAPVMALEIKASVVHLTGDCSEATPLYEETATAAEAAGVDGVRAMARIGVLECAIATSSDLAQIERLTDQTRAAIQRAGDDAQLTAVLDLTLSSLDATRGDLDAAIERVDRARVLFEQVGDWRRASTAATTAAQYRLSRDGVHNTDPAFELYKRAHELAVRAYPPGHVAIARAQMLYGMMLIDRDPAAGKQQMTEAVAAMPREPLPADAPTVTGLVIDAAGKPVAGATISAAPELTAAFDGEPLPIYQPQYVKTTSDADGRFALTVPRGAVMMAAAPGLRSLPVSSKRAPIELRLAPGVAVDVAIDMTPPQPPPDADPTVAITARTTALVVVLTYQKDQVAYAAFGRLDGPGRYRFTDLPPLSLHAVVIGVSPLGDQIGLALPLDLRTPHTAPVAFAVDLRGSVLDVIVRADRGAIPTAQVLILERPLRKLPTTVSELLPNIFASGRWHVANAIAVSPATHTSVGAPLYRAADIHARLSSVTPGRVTVCVVPFAGDIADPSYASTLAKYGDLEVRCELRTITAAPLQAVEIAAPPMKNAP